eukprot:SRR837773.9006.p1 GENE.SRR837773.9006~~SRR837773.9006.p1  ORF type:complete len:497 (+),score=100.25 SRR837773.9006:107-1492(+)
MSPGGGFASKFQLVAAKAMKALRAGKAFRLVGHFAGYTATRHCEEAVGSSLYKSKGSYTCFFEPERSCEDGSRGEGDGQSKAALEKLAHLSREQEAEVYQALEAYLFRLNFDTVNEFEKRHALVGFDEAATDCLVGVHARRGDKVVDAYNRYYTSKEYAQTIFTWASQADRCKSSETTCTVYVASDSSVVMPEIKGYLEPVSAGACRFRVIGNERSVTQKAMDSHRFDKVDEIQGMAGKVQLLRGEEAKQATLDILFDIYMLSRSNFVVGTLTSQIGRIATGLKNAVKYAPAAGSPPVALDYSNWRAVEAWAAATGSPRRWPRSGSPRSPTIFRWIVPRVRSGSHRPWIQASSRSSTRCWPCRRTAAGPPSACLSASPQAASSRLCFGTPRRPRRRPSGRVDASSSPATLMATPSWRCARRGSAASASPVPAASRASSCRRARARLVRPLRLPPRRQPRRL